MSDINALEEMRDAIERSKSTVVAADISFNSYKHVLYEHHTPTEWASFVAFMKSIDYDNGYGGQMLFGTIWLADGTRIERGEYDGSEWWEHVVKPSIPVRKL